MGYLILPYKRYFDFSGRSRRKEFWLFQLFFCAVCFAVMLAGDLASAMYGGAALGEAQGVNDTVPSLIGFFWLGSLIPAIAVTVRRLHDQDKSAIWLLWLVLGIGWLVLAVVMMLKGDEGENLYGHDPRMDDASSNAEVFA